MSLKTIFCSICLIFIIYTLEVSAGIGPFNQTTFPVKQANNITVSKILQVTTPRTPLTSSQVPPVNPSVIYNDRQKREENKQNQTNEQQKSQYTQDVNNTVLQNEDQEQYLNVTEINLIKKFIKDRLSDNSTRSQQVDKAIMSMFFLFVTRVPWKKPTPEYMAKVDCENSKLLNSSLANGTILIDCDKIAAQVKAANTVTTESTVDEDYETESTVSEDDTLTTTTIKPPIKKSKNWPFNLQDDPIIKAAIDEIFPSYILPKQNIVSHIVSHTAVHASRDSEAELRK